MIQRSVVAVLMPAAAFRGTDDFSLPLVLFPYLFGELMAAPRLLILKDQNIFLRDTDESTHRRKGVDVGLGFL